MLRHHNTSSCPPQRVVLLGAGGFISSYLQRLLKKYEVPYLAIGKSKVDLTQPQCCIDLQQLILPSDTVVFLAALTPDRGKTNETLMLNLAMAWHVGDALKKIGCHQLVYISSDAVYDAHKIPLDEDSSREPTNLYALMHTAREMMLKNILPQISFPLAILRPSSIYGFGDTHNSYGPNRFIRTALTEKKITLYGKGEEKRSHIYIEDVVELIRLTLFHRSEGELNLVVSPSISYFEIAQKVMRLIPEKILIIYELRQLKPIHRPYKATQVFRFLSNLGKKISPIVHRPYFNKAIFKSFPNFSFTSMTSGVKSTINSVRQS